MGRGARESRAPAQGRSAPAAEWAHNVRMGGNPGPRPAARFPRLDGSSSSERSAVITGLTLLLIVDVRGAAFYTAWTLIGLALVSEGAATMVALVGLTPRPRRVTRSRSGRPKCTTAAQSASRRRARMVPTSEARSRMGARRTKVGCDAKRAKRWPSPDDAPSWEDSARRPNSASALRVGVGLAGPGWSYNASASFGSGSRRRRWTATTARGVAATASRTGWRTRVRRVRRDSEGDPYRNLVGVQLHAGMMSGSVVLQAPGQSGSKTSYWKQGDDDPFKAPNAIPVSRPSTRPRKASLNCGG